MALDAGTWVTCLDRWHGDTVAARVLGMRGSEVHVSWISQAGGLFEMCFPEEDVAVLTLPAPAAKKEKEEAEAPPQHSPPAGPPEAESHEHAHPPARGPGPRRRPREEG